MGPRESVRGGVGTRTARGTRRTCAVRARSTAAPVRTSDGFATTRRDRGAIASPSTSARYMGGRIRPGGGGDEPK